MKKKKVPYPIQNAIYCLNLKTFRGQNVNSAVWWKGPDFCVSSIHLNCLQPIEKRQKSSRSVNAKLQCVCVVWRNGVNSISIVRPLILMANYQIFLEHIINWGCAVANAYACLHRCNAVPLRLSHAFQSILFPVIMSLYQSSLHVTLVALCFVNVIL